MDFIIFVLFCQVFPDKKAVYWPVRKDPAENADHALNNENFRACSHGKEPKPPAH